MGNKYGSEGNSPAFSSIAEVAAGKPDSVLDRPSSMPYRDKAHKKTKYNRGRPEYLDSGYTGIMKWDHDHRKPFWETLRKFGVKLIYNHSKLGNAVIDNPGGDEGLHVIYDYDPDKSRYGILIKDHRKGIPFKDTMKKLIEIDTDGQDYNWLDHFFLNLRACYGVRNRKTEYQEMMREATRRLYNENGKPIRVLDAGSGRGEVPLEAFSDLLGDDGIKKEDISIHLLDVSEEALAGARTNSEKYGLGGITETVNLNLKRQGLSEFYPDAVHLIGGHGLVDYFSSEEKKGLLDKFASIQDSGKRVVITQMTKHNDYVADVLMKVAGRWNPEKETPEETKGIILENGRYKINEVRVVSDTDTRVFRGDKQIELKSPKKYFFSLWLLERN